MILTILGGFVLLTLPIIYFASQSRNIPVSRAAIKVVLGQTQDYRLSLNTLAVENSYSSDYQLEIPFGYYNIKILGDDDTVFFSGKVNKNLVRYPPDEMEVESKQTTPPDLSVEPLSKIVLFLPYYTRGKKIVFFDEKNVEKLQVDLHKVTLPKDYAKKLCGNGVCDFSENFLSCYKDCRFRLR